MRAPTMKFLPFLLSILLGCAAMPPDVAEETKEDEQIAELQEQIEAQKKYLREVRKELAELKAQQEKPTPSLPVEKIRPPEVIAEKKNVSTEEERIAESSGHSMELYYQGLEQIRDKKYDMAIDSFRKFLAENPSHVYADRAQYLIGEAHFQTKEFGLSMVAFNLLLTRYPESNE